MKPNTDAVDSRTSKIDQIDAILGGEDLERAWKGCLSAWEGSSPAQRADCRAFIITMRDNFLRIIRDVDDPQERETVAALFYTQIKAQWILINTQSGYQIQNGTVNGALFCRSGMISALLGAMEPMLRPVDLTRITDFLAGPQDLDPADESELLRLEGLLGADVFPAEPLSDGSPSGKVVVNARSLENRLRELITRLDDSEREWLELQADLGVSERSEIPALFDKLNQAGSSDGIPSSTEDTLAHAARVEWAERRELQLRALRKEVGILRAEWQHVAHETGAADASCLVAVWRETKDALAECRRELANEQDVLTVLRSEYGDDVSAPRIVADRRDLSSRLAEKQAQWEKRRAEIEYLEREFGTFDPTQMVALVRGLRDRIAELAARSPSEFAVNAILAQEFGTTSIDGIVARFRELRDTLARSTQEMVTLRADQDILQSEMGKTDAREIVAHVRSLEAQIKSFHEMSELLGSMEQALKTLNS